MTHIYKYTSMVALLVCLAGCIENLPVFDAKTTWLNFNIRAAADSTRYYSFIYAKNPNAVVDTVWIELIISGNAVNYDRAISFTQLLGTNEDVPDAISNVHFVAFDDPAVKNRYILPAGVHSVSVPVVVKRDQSLNDSDVLLFLEIAGNNDFQPGFRHHNRLRLYISNRFAQPDNWNATTIRDIATYTSELHEFLVMVTGEKWDYDFLLTLGYITPIPYYPYPQYPDYISYYYTDNDIYDVQYIGYIRAMLKEKLAEENEKRIVQGLPPWNITFVN